MGVAIMKTHQHGARFLVHITCFSIEQELNRKLYDAIKVSLKGIKGAAKAEGLIDGLYRTKQASETHCPKCRTVKENEVEEGFDLLPSVKGVCWHTHPALVVSS